jgi:hypothetical protein
MMRTARAPIAPFHSGNFVLFMVRSDFLIGAIAETTGIAKMRRRTFQTNVEESQNAKEKSDGFAFSTEFL